MLFRCLLVCCVVCTSLVPLRGAAQSIDREPVARIEAPARQGRPIPGRFIITLQERTDPRAVAQEHGVNPDFVYSRVLTGFAGRLSEAARSGLLRDSRVVRVEIDREMLGQQSWGTDRIDQRNLPLDGKYSALGTARGITVYVVDTGIRFDHVLFGGRAMAGFDAIGDGRNGSDCNGHGTHVAGTAAGGRQYGVAGEAMLVSVRVLDCEGRGANSGVIAGLDWIAGNAQRPAVVNMSLGGSASATLDAAVRRVISRGLAVVVAAGNSAADACASSPAGVAEALTIGATTRVDSRASFSNYGECVDVFAPGEEITSAWHTASNALAISSGTSMAAPHVAGLVALMLEKSPTASPSELSTKLVQDATRNIVSNAQSTSNHLIYTGTGAATNAITGTNGADAIIGTTGADTMSGGPGDDVYRVDHHGDAVVELPNEGIDEIQTTLATYSISDLPNVENVSAATASAHRLTGNNGANVIKGGDGADGLIGLSGADTLIGGAGDDSYIISDERATARELGSGGYDTVYTTVNYKLPAGSHIEVLTPYERATTTPLRLTGNELANIIYGTGGANALVGLGGADTLYGLAGDDTYLVADTLATVIERSGEGRDTTYVTADFTLGSGSEVEVLTVYDRTSTNTVRLRGNGLNNIIHGNNGSNLLVGGGGSDFLHGHGGDDAFIVAGSSEQVIEHAGGGYDTVYTTGSYTLPEHSYIEVLSFYDRSTANGAELVGNGAVNAIHGNQGANRLDGKNASDTLFGHGGADVFAFTTDLGPANIDKLMDFASGMDRFALNLAAFAGLSIGPLSASAFARGTAAQDGDDHIIYDQASGALYFDSDGAGGAAAVQFAQLGAGTALTASDFVVFE